ncbi:hypothetical protein DRQ25_16275, partial [Candidatus Fermentibacteria bacterium]
MIKADKHALMLIAVAWVVAMILIFGVSAVMAEGDHYDSSLTPSVVATCTHPTSRTDGSYLSPEELGNIDLYITTTPGAEGEPYYSGPACSAQVILSALPTGQYYRHWRQWDEGG